MTLEALDLPPESLRRPMCSMSRHNGVVTCVKFSPDGRFLASGSDDKIILIWEKDEEQSNRHRQFGELEADLEHWTVRKRLVAHENDIQDICWSPDGSLLVTVGLDRLIIIWNGTTFERIKRYDIHQSMVKGIVFDPANKFFATASDDRTVRIFRYHKKLNESNYEFQIEAVVIEPFKKSPLTSYFRRMSWSPDGQHIAVPNATNGPVTSISIINRGNWATDISLIGHEAPSEVCSFSPRLFKVKGSDNDDTDNFTTILATGGQDRTLAIWSTCNSKPLVVASDIVQSSITDICWAQNGETLYFSSLDGSITCIVLEKNELGEVVSADINDLQLHRFGADRESLTFPESVEQLTLEKKAENSVIPLVRRSVTPVKVPEKVEPVIEKAPVVNNLTPKQTQKLNQSITITKSGKKRISPLLISSSTSSITSKLPVIKSTADSKTNFKVSKSSYYLPRLGIQTSVNGIKLRELSSHYNSKELNEDNDNDNEDMVIDESNNPNQSNISEISLKRQRNRNKRIFMESRYPSTLKLISGLPESLFSSQSVLNCEINNILKGVKDSPIELTNSSSIEVDESIIFSVVVGAVQHLVDSDVKEIDNIVEDTKITSTIEVRNGQSWDYNENEFDYDPRIDFQDPTMVIVSNTLLSDKRKFTLYFPYKIQHALPIIINDILVYYILVSSYGTLQIILAESGNYLCPGLELGSNVVTLRQSNEFIMAVTSSGLIYTWKLNIKEHKIQPILNGVSLAPIMSSIPLPAERVPSKKVPSLILPELKCIMINPQDGSPFVIMNHVSNVYKYSIDLQTWQLVLDSWYYLPFLDNGKIQIDKDGIINSLFKLTYGTFKDDIQRKKFNKYVFNETNTELQSSMKDRFIEMMHYNI